MFRWAQFTETIPLWLSQLILIIWGLPAQQQASKANSCVSHFHNKICAGILLSCLRVLIKPFNIYFTDTDSIWISLHQLVYTGPLCLRLAATSTLTLSTYASTVSLQQMLKLVGVFGRSKCPKFISSRFSSFSNSYLRGVDTLSVLSLQGR